MTQMTISHSLLAVEAMRRGASPSEAAQEVRHFWWALRFAKPVLGHLPVGNILQHVPKLVH